MKHTSILSVAALAIPACPVLSFSTTAIATATRKTHQTLSPLSVSLIDGVGKADNKGGFWNDVFGEEESSIALWERMGGVAASIQEKNPVRGGVFSLQAVTAEDPDIISELEAANVSFEMPTTLSSAVHGYLTHGGGGFLVSVLAITCLFRVLACDTPLGVADLLAVAGTRVFWEVQEWAVHSSWFHGEEDGRAIDLFKTHDRHHDLPYYHLAVEPLRMVVNWFLVVLSISVASVGVLGATPAIVATSFATYQASGLFYSFMHLLCHSRVPLKGYLKECKENHIKHHVSPTHHLNMGPNRIDMLMGTDSYDARFQRQGLK